MMSETKNTSLFMRIARVSLFAIALFAMIPYYNMGTSVLGQVHIAPATHILSFWLSIPIWPIVVPVVALIFYPVAFFSVVLTAAAFIFGFIFIIALLSAMGNSEPLYALVRVR